MRLQTKLAGDAGTNRRKNQMQTTTPPPLLVQTVQIKPDTKACNIGLLLLLIGCGAIAIIPIFGWMIGGPLALVAFILSIIGMSKNDVGNGVCLLLMSLVAPWVAQFCGIILWMAIGASSP
jgi:hypothetical protein